MVKPVPRYQHFQSKILGEKHRVEQNISNNGQLQSIRTEGFELGSDVQEERWEARQYSSLADG